MTAYYNEIDPRGAASLRELIRAGIIAPGDVDERSIEDVRPGDLAGYVQCHFFAGIGVWSYAIRCAGWPDDRPVWTASCPCQPFSAAGKGAGIADERHLWPAFLHLVRVRRPRAVFGEQVSSKDGLAWLNHVRTDLEGEGYAVGVTDLCAAGFGAPHIRQRLYFVADSECGATERHGQPVGGTAGGDQGIREAREGAQRVRDDVGDGEYVGGVADAEYQGHHRGAERGGIGPSEDEGGLLELEGCRAVGLMGHSCLSGLGGYGRSGREPVQAGRQGEERHDTETSGFGPVAESVSEQKLSATAGGFNAESGERGPTNGFWRNAEWIPCRTKVPGAVEWRPIEPGTFPLAHGAPARVGRLHGYGNAIVAPVAEAFVRAYMEINTQ